MIGVFLPLAFQNCQIAGMLYFWQITFYEFVKALIMVYHNDDDHHNDYQICSDSLFDVWQAAWDAGWFVRIVIVIIMIITIKIITVKI